MVLKEYNKIIVMIIKRIMIKKNDYDDNDKSEQQ